MHNVNEFIIAIDTKPLHGFPMPDPATLKLVQQISQRHRSVSSTSVIGCTLLTANDP
jgi:hypothetical protein